MRASSAARRDARIGIRISEEKKQRWIRAAALAGYDNLTEFMEALMDEAALQKAEEVAIIRLSELEATSMIEILQEPTRPMPAALAEAANIYRSVMDGEPTRL